MDLTGTGKANGAGGAKVAAHTILCVTLFLKNFNKIHALAISLS